FIGLYDRNRYPNYVKSTSWHRSTYNPKPTSGLKAELLADTGALPWNRDSVDEELIAHLKAKTGTIIRSGTYPSIKGGIPYPDADGDGMDDNWELTNNLNPKDKSDGQMDRNNDGYTNLDEFLFSLTVK